MKSIVVGNTLTQRGIPMHIVEAQDAAEAMAKHG